MPVARHIIPGLLCDPQTKRAMIPLYDGCYAFEPARAMVLPLLREHGVPIGDYFAQFVLAKLDGGPLPP